MTAFLLMLLACGPSQEEAATARLQQAGLTDIELVGDNGVYEFKGNKGKEYCAGTVHVPASGEMKVEMFCDRAWGPETVAIPYGASKQGRERANACDRGDLLQCALLGTDYRDGTNGIPGSKDDALRLFTSSCDGEVYQACTYLADVYDQGKLVERDDDKAMGLYDKACKLGSQISCKRLGRDAPTP